MSVGSWPSARGPPARSSASRRGCEGRVADGRGGGTPRHRAALRAPCLFFFLMIGRPPRSTPFPYPPLFRSAVGQPFDAGRYDRHRERHAADSCAGPGRSEEHTSELQSHDNLVCRLLLEKNKDKLVSYVTPDHSHKPAHRLLL